MPNGELIYTNSKGTAIVMEVELSDGSYVYDVYSQGNNYNIQVSDLDLDDLEIACFTCPNKSLAVALAMHIAQCCV